MLRLNSGKFGGRLIATPTSGTRPVTDKVRAAIFSTLASKVEGASLLDLYAGSGALGFEAISRGGSSLVLVDNGKQAQTAILENINKLGLAKQAELRVQPVESFLSSVDKHFDLIFFDPPYDSFDSALAEKAINLLKSDGILVVSCSNRKSFESDFIIKQKTYGDSKISYLTR